MKNFSHLVCPNCGSRFSFCEKTLCCKSGHSFDIAKEGYVNLLPPHKQGSVPGDNAEMVRARRLFLSKGYYEPLRKKLTEVVSSLSPELFIDAGCGEGYYTSEISKHCSGDTVGIDISKYAVKAAAKADKSTAYVAANVHSLPFENESADVILSCFCAYDEKEYARVLKKGGSFILVLPEKRHLFGMKEILYDEPYENPAETPELGDFEHTKKEILSYRISIADKDGISELYAMTPYQWNTCKEGAERLLAVSELDTETEFAIHTFIRR